MTKQLLLLCAAAACTFSLQATASSHSSENPVNARQHLAKIAKEQRESASKWLPGTITNRTRSVNSQGNYVWKVTSEAKITYNERGQKITVIIGSKKTTYQYDGNGNLVQEFCVGDGIPYVISYDYDKKTNRLIAESRQEGESAMYVVSVHRLDIKRDFRGNIIRVDDRSYNPETDQSEINNYSVIEYTDGKASRIVNYDIDEGNEVVEFELTDIVWKNTDGQLIIENTNDMDIEDYFIGANRVESAVIRNYNNDGFDVRVNATYYEDENLVVVTMTSLVDNKEFYKVMYQDLDSYGSYSEEKSGYDYVIYDGQVFWRNNYWDNVRYQYDAYGILIDYKRQTFKDYEKNTYTSHTDVSYDETYGYPVKTMVYLNGDRNAQYITEYHDYAEYSAVEGIVSDENAPVEYFNLQGIRVENPAAGIYIRRQGSETKKVLIK